jgi:hypothetical protein
MFLSHAIDAAVFVASINTRGVRRFVRRQRSLSTIDIGAARVKALVKEKAGPGFALKNVPEPTIKDNEVLIRVRRAGVCGTDVHIYDWDPWAQGRVKPVKSCKSARS